MKTIYFAICCLTVTALCSSQKHPEFEAKYVIFTSMNEYNAGKVNKSMLPKGSLDLRP